MNEEMKIKNVLYNYYAISRFELERYKDDKDNDHYLVSYYAENVIKDLLNNCFCISLYENSSKLLYHLNKLFPEVFNNIENKQLYDNLKDSISFYDNRLLRKDDPVDLVMKALMVYLTYYRKYEVTDQQEVLKHRYDIIYNELIKDEYVASLLIKMAIHLTNNQANVVLKLRKEYKYSVFIEAINEVKNMYYSILVALLFKDMKGINLRLRYLYKYILSLNYALDLYPDNRQLIVSLNDYSDVYYSVNHNIKVVNDKFEYHQEFGFLTDDMIKEIKNYKVSDDEYNSLIKLNELTMNFYDKLNKRFGDFDVENINQTLNDINTLLKDI